MHDIPVIAVPGGPCSAKTTGLSRISDRLLDRGIRPLIIGEAATLLITGGVTCGNEGLSNAEFQRHILRTQLALHARFADIAQSYQAIGKRVAVFSDRGTIDGAGYISWPEFVAIAESEGYSIPALSAGMYKAVCHLDTAPREFYTTANNSARKETWEEAMLLNDRIKEAWLRTEHPHYGVIGNEGGLEHKLNRLFASICRVLGIPAPIEIERRFLVRMPNFADFQPFVPQGALIEQVYLRSQNDWQRRIRKRTQEGFNLYFETLKRFIREGVRAEEERFIDPYQYVTLVARERDPKRDIIRKRRHCFLWKNQYFELDVFLEPERLKGRVILEHELTEEGDRVELPPFIDVIREITSERDMNNSELALIP